MINIEGKIVLTELEELVDPAHTALIVIDMQRDFIEPDGLFATLGIDLSMYARVEAEVGGLAGCRPHDRHDRRALAEHGACRPNERFAGPDPVQSPNAQGRSPQPAAVALHRFRVRQGTSSPQNSRPLENELVVAKYRSSGFWGTNLDMLLRSNGIKTVVVAGARRKAASSPRHATRCSMISTS